MPTKRIKGGYANELRRISEAVIVGVDINLLLDGKRRVQHRRLQVVIVQSWGSRTTLIRIVQEVESTAALGQGRTRLGRIVHGLGVKARAPRGKQMLGKGDPCSHLRPLLHSGAENLPIRNGWYR